MTSRPRAPTIPLASALVLLALLAAPARATADRPARPRAARPATAPGSDFNGDGIADLAMGVPGESIGTAVQAGGVNVIDGSPTGLTDAGNQAWSQDTASVADAAETGDQMGFSVATGDFNGDGFSDLAVGVPGEDVGSTDDAGAVNVLYGSAAGLTATGNQLWTEDSSGIPGAAEVGDQFGFALAAGDLNHDGFVDLAVGAPGDSVSGAGLAGAVTVIPGSAAGLTATGSTLWDQDTTGIADQAEPNDQFGYALAMGDFGGDGVADLAVGAPGESVGSASGAGLVEVIPGSSAGPTAAGSQAWTQNSSSVMGTAETQDLFGFSLCAGDFNRDGRSDLAVGAPFEDVGSTRDAGSVNVLYGSAGGLSATGNQLWDQDSDGVADSSEASDEFGFSLAGADWNGDRRADLAVGVVGEDLPARDAGAVNVLYGSASGLASAGNQLWTQDSPGVMGSAEAGDQFGAALAAGRFGGTFGSLVIGVPFEDVGSIRDAGAIGVLAGSSTGLTSTGNQLWDQDSPGIQDAAESGDAFGDSLGSGRAAA